MTLIRIKLPRKYLALLHHFNRERLTCHLKAYDTTKKLDHLKPIQSGIISFTYDKLKFRPYRYEMKVGRSYRFMKAKDVIELLGSASLVVMLKFDKPTNLNEYLDFLRYAGASRPRILEACQDCMNDFELTRIDSQTTYNNHGREVCKNCAQQTIRTEYTKRGIPLTSSARKFFTSQLERTRSVEHVIETLWENSVIHHDSSSTLFDIIPADNKRKAESITRYLDRNNLKVDSRLIKQWQKIGMKKLMPVQMEALENGLLRKEDMLVVAGTSSGKTFIGEIAGLQNWAMRNSTFIFVTPLVALTNQKYDSFKKRYRPLGARVAIRVGKSRIVDEGKTDERGGGRIKNADIVVATYEALDWIFRSGEWKKISNIGTLVIDEFQLLADEERGMEVDGLLSRIRILYPKCQVIALSATIGNEKQLAKQMNMKLVNYMNRPIPLERHLVISDKEETKLDILEKYVREESKIQSSSRFMGQTLIFTNTRRRVQEIGNLLKGLGIRSSYYHAGMTYNQRRAIEKKFERGELDVLTTTAALGAGADFPVSQVIFERPAMGAKWLTIAEYHQMAGRAGRLGYHDKGKAILIATVGEKIYNTQTRSEEQVAFDLLTGSIEEVDGEVEYEDELDQVLAFISAAYPLNEETIRQYYNTLFYRTKQLSAILKSLLNYGMIAKKEGRWYISPLGRAVSSSFLKPSFGFSIAKKTSNRSINEIAVEIAPIKSVYLTSRMQGRIEQALKTHVASRFFSSTVLEAITDLSRVRGKIAKSLQDQIRFWQHSFFDCSCKINPYCEHPIEKLSLLILKIRMDGMPIKQIINHLSKNYDIMIYHGDLLNWLDEIVHAVNAIGRLAKAMKMQDIVNETAIVSLQIEAPEINMSVNQKIIKNTKPLRKKPARLARKQKKQHRRNR